MSAIQTSELRFRYRGSREWALSGVSVDIEPGSFMLLLGPSGSGKSTLARCFNGLVPHSGPGELTGEIEVCGRNVEETPQIELAQRVGLVFQNPELQFVTSTVETEVAFGLENICVPASEMPVRIDDALETVGLSGQATREIETLSGGEKQRLAIACQLVMEPDVLVLDEPTANLDPRGTEAVYRRSRPSASGLDPEAVHALGEIPRTHQDHLIGKMEREDGVVEDPIVDDQSIVVETDDGLALVLGCCHAGLRNTVEYAESVCAGEVRHVIGGTHLIAVDSERVREIADWLARKLDRLVGAHCTGTAAMGILNECLPETFEPAGVGTTLQLD